MNSKANAILTDFYGRANQKNAEGMARFGIRSSKKVLGVSSKFIFALAKQIRTDHQLALDLWETGVYEARLLAAFIADPERMTTGIMNRWVRDFDNWAICDCACMHCFRDTAAPHKLIMAWIKRKDEFVRRAGFTMMATLSVSDKKAGDKIFLKYLPVVKKYSTDERNFVKKAVNWALRQIGKRSLRLNSAAIKTASEIHKINSSSAKWIASDALRELKSIAVQKRLRKKPGVPK